MKHTNSLLCLLIIYYRMSVSYAKQFNYEYVTCGSALKLLNVGNSVRLHSHDVKYGSGSGQQSVTAVDASDDHNSYWKINGKSGSSCKRGMPIKCGQTVRLLHVSTGRNLHSHHFSSPLSHNLEVSAFGNDGVGDEGDNWAVVCSDEYWRRDGNVRFRHMVTNHFLHVSGDTYGRPINGQKEVCGFQSVSNLNLWKAAEGIFMKPANEMSTPVTHDEF